MDNTPNNVQVLNIDLDRIVAIPMSENELLQTGFVRPLRGALYHPDAADILVISGEDYDSLSRTMALPKVDLGLTQTLLVTLFKQYSDEEGLGLGMETCNIIFECLPALDGSTMQMALKNVAFFVEEWSEKSVDEMACELDITTDNLSRDEVIDCIEDALNNMDIIHIESFYGEDGLRWSYKGELSN